VLTTSVTPLANAAKTAKSRKMVGSNLLTATGPTFGGRFLEDGSTTSTLVKC